MLAWSIHEKGFPPRRTWRLTPAWMHPRSAALAGDALWLDTERGALALDLESGAIRRVEASPRAAAGVSDEDPYAAMLAQQREEGARERPDRLARAEKGDAQAMFDLGWASEDPAEAAAWYRMAAEGGHARAMFEWATRLYQGRGVAEDRGASKAWLERAARAGHPGAKEVLVGLFP